MNTNLVKNILKVMSQGDKPFYASDLGLNGGEINGLVLNRYLKPTGNSREVEITVDCWNVAGGTMKKTFTVQAKEWQAASPVESLSEFVSPEWADEIAADYAGVLAKAIAQAREIVAMADALGF